MNHTHTFRTGARWLIAEHRRCIGELKRIKGMIADLAKYIATLSGKGRALQIRYDVLDILSYLTVLAYR